MYFLAEFGISLELVYSKVLFGVNLKVQRMVNFLPVNCSGQSVIVNSDVSSNILAVSTDNDLWGGLHQIRN